MRPRALSGDEVEALLREPVPCRLATMDAAGFPRVTPLWFLWADGCFWMTSLTDRQHLADLTRCARAGLCVDVEAPAATGRPHRPNRQVTARGLAETFPESDGQWTRRITTKYVPGAAGALHADERAAQQRLVVCFRPTKLSAFGHA